MYGTLLMISQGLVTGSEDVLSDGQSNRELFRGHMKARRQPSNSSITNVPIFICQKRGQIEKSDIRSILELCECLNVHRHATAGVLTRKDKRS